MNKEEINDKKNSFMEFVEKLPKAIEGLPCFLIVLKNSKKPKVVFEEGDTKTWRQRQFTYKEIIEKIESGSDFNIGLDVTKIEGLLVLDIDVNSETKKVGFETAKRLLKENGILFENSSLHIQTISKNKKGKRGAHFYFLQNEKSKSIIKKPHYNNIVKDFEFFSKETFNGSKYVLVPPSSIDGNVYEIKNKSINMENVPELFLDYLEKEIKKENESSFIEAKKERIPFSQDNYFFKDDGLQDIENILKCINFDVPHTEWIVLIACIKNTKLPNAMELAIKYSLDGWNGNGENPKATITRSWNSYESEKYTWQSLKHMAYKRGYQDPPDPNYKKNNIQDELLEDYHKEIEGAKQYEIEAEAEIEEPKEADDIIRKGLIENLNLEKYETMNNFLNKDHNLDKTNGDWLITGFLTIFSSFYNSNVFLQNSDSQTWGEKRTYSNKYTVFAGVSGCGKSVILKGLENFQNKVLDDKIFMKLPYDKDGEPITNSNNEHIEMPMPPMKIGGDFSSDTALLQMLQNNVKIIHIDEISSLFKKGSSDKSYENQVSNKLRSTYSATGGKINKSFASKDDVYIENVFLNLLGSIPKSELIESINIKDYENGLMSRFEMLFMEDDDLKEGGYIINTSNLEAEKFALFVYYFNEVYQEKKEGYKIEYSLNLFNKEQKNGASLALKNFSNFFHEKNKEAIKNKDTFKSAVYSRSFEKVLKYSLDFMMLRFYHSIKDELTFEKGGVAIETGVSEENKKPFSAFKAKLSFMQLSFTDVTNAGAIVAYLNKQLFDNLANNLFKNLLDREIKNYENAYITALKKSRLYRKRATESYVTMDNQYGLTGFSYEQITDKKIGGYIPSSKQLRKEAEEEMIERNELLIIKNRRIILKYHSTEDLINFFEKHNTGNNEEERQGVKN